MRALWAVALALGVMAGALSSADAAAIKHVIVIAMENEDASDIYAAGGRAPYIGWLRKNFASAEHFVDLLPGLPSEPHYLLIEGGDNVYGAYEFRTDGDPSAGNLAASGQHLVNQIEATKRLTWTTYQEGVAESPRTCPIASAGRYVAKHNPFVFYADVVGAAPSEKSRRCIAHTRPFSALAADLAADRLANYVFITPDLCHDMHGDVRCLGADPVSSGDAWLAREMPPLIRYANAHRAAIFLVWDQGSPRLFGAASENAVPFFAIGPGVKVRPSEQIYDHRSLVKSVEEIFGLPILPKVAKAKDFADLFRPGQFP